MPDADSANGILELVRTMTAAAGLRPSDDELATLAEAYPALRGAADRLYPLAADADPAPVFDPVSFYLPADTADRSAQAGSGD
jgi:hypothetical protein